MDGEQGLRGTLVVLVNELSGVWLLGGTQMSDEIRVTVIRYPDRANLVLAYTDPVSGKRQTKSAGTSKEKDAWKKAAAWEEELRAGPLCPPSKVTWESFRQRYEEEHLATLAPETRQKAGYALDRVERYLNPDRLVKLTAGALSTFQAKLRDTGAKDTTIAAVLRHVKAALSWGVSVGMLAKVPKIVMPKKAKGRKMKGGALVAEQFERMLAAVPKVRAHDAPEWTRYLRGLWLSGLRLEESVALSWDADTPFAIDLSGKRPRFKIKGEAQKSGQDELLPMTPDFAELILRTPESERRGRVFRLNHARRGSPLDGMAVGKLVTKIGKKAGVVVATVEKRKSVDGKLVTTTVKKFASAHDLRRSFGTRWAQRVRTPVLQRLMRHASIETTLGYYVDLNVDEMADDLWANHPAGENGGNKPAPGNRIGNIRPVDAPALTDGLDVNSVVVGS
jgi:integrase